MHIVVSGGTGFIGKPLLQSLSDNNYHTILLTRHPHSSKPHLLKNIMLEKWDAEKDGPWAQSIDGAQAVINLTGEPIAAKRWTAHQKRILLTSRIHSTKAIVQAIAKAKNKPSVLINASAVGFYGNVPEGDVTESNHAGDGFLAEVCAAWEKEALKASEYGVRVVLLRIGIVMEMGGGALEKMLPPFKMFAGGPLGSGKQWFPWIHRDDIIGAILFALKNPSISGPINLTAPTPVRMNEFCSALGHALGRPSWAPVPGFALKLLLGEMSEMLLNGQKVLPEKLLKAGYKFKHPELGESLRSILKTPKQTA